MAVRCYDSVDVDGSGAIVWSEFVFALMGRAALNFGPLANLEALNNLLQYTKNLLKSMSSDLADTQVSMNERAERNSELRARLTSMRNEFEGEMGGMLTVSAAFFSLELPLECVCMRKWAKTNSNGKCGQLRAAPISTE